MDKITASYQSPELDAIRKHIDALDNQVHDLLMERADLVMQISEEKKRNGIQIVQPAREAIMIRRLMERHRAPLPQETIVRIWRELVGSISLLQTGLSVAVASPESETMYWDMARDYFGTMLPMHKTPDPLAALDSLKNNKVNFAVLPWPKNGETNPWWQELLHDPSYKIIQRLPFGNKKNYNYHEHPALIVSMTGFASSGDDHSMIGIKSGKPLSVRDLQNRDFVSVSVSADKMAAIIEVNTYITDDESAERFLNLDFQTVTVKCLGGFPAPLIYKDAVT